MNGGFVPGRHLIEAYGGGGFRFAGMSHRGSILALPSGIRAWAPASPADLTPEAFDPVIAEAGAITTLIVGTGRDMTIVPPETARRLREAGIGCDVMRSGAAVGVYNVMCAENRPVGAALLAVA